MIAELGIALTLAVTGFGVMAVTSPRLSPTARALMSVPVGAAMYMSVAVVWVLASERLAPGAALAITGAIGVSCLLRRLVRRRVESWKEAVWLLGGVVLVTLIARVVHLAILSPDSLRYILFSIHLVGPDGIEAVHAPDLMNRQIGYPSLQALSVLTDRQYLASIGPLFGVSAFGFLGWLLWRESEPGKMRLLLVAIAGAFLLSTNRFLYSWFYINSHILIAAYLLIAVAGTWLAAKDSEHQWGWPVGISLGATILLRPDAPLFAVVVLVVLASTALGMRFRIPAVAPIAVLAAIWYGLVLFPHPHYQSYMSLTSPVMGNMLGVAGGVAIVLLARAPAFRHVYSHLDKALLVAMTLGFGLLAWRDLEVVGDTAKATVMNVEFGAWLFTWPALSLLTVVAVFRHRITHGRLWTVPVLAFFLLYWILPLVRGAAWRIGIGDSGNRLLIHFVAIVVGLLILSARASQPDEATA